MGDKDKFQVALESFQAQCRTESMVTICTFDTVFLINMICVLLQIRAASSLMSITHSLKLLLLLSDEAQIVHQHNKELRTARGEAEESREAVARLLDELLCRRSGENEDVP